MDEAPWMAHAWAELGQREVAGGGDNPRIVALYREIGHAEATHDEVAWCAALVGASLQRAGIGSTRSLLARSYLAWGQALTAPRLGAVAIFSRGSDAVSGHVGFYLDSDASRVFVLGGNQTDAVTVTAIERSRLLGLRWPANTPSPATSTAAAAPKPADLFDVALAHELEMEGGWTEDQFDPGGPTNFGITISTLAAVRGVTLDEASFESLRQQLRDISPAEVPTIYTTRYWQPSQAPLLPPPLALMHFDAAVNQGLGAAARMLQQAVGATIDGEIGPQTLAACAATPALTAVARYADARRERYRALTHFWRFGRGWLARVDATQNLATSLAKQPTKGHAQMTDTTTTTKSTAATPAQSQPAEDRPIKWWGESMTIWGVLITTATTVVPVLGPVLGLDIPAELIKQLGTQGSQAVQAVGGLFGTLLTIYGRMRAGSKLSLRSVTLRL